MSKKQTPFFIKIPYWIIRDESLDNRPGILMAYCWLRRNGSLDGRIISSLNTILEDLHLSFHDNKLNNYPKQLLLIIRGIEYLCNKGILILKNGDYHSFNNIFVLHFDFNYLDGDNYVSLDYADFDYIINMEGRFNKTYMLFTLLWVKSNFIKINVDGTTQYCVACSYKLEKMAKYMKMKERTLYNHLNILSCKEGETGNQPLYKCKRYSIKIKNQLIILPNIYVENIGEPLQIIELKKNEIQNKFRGHKEIDSDIYDGTFDDELDELFS